MGRDVQMAANFKGRQAAREAEERRAQQQRLFHRNQMLGLLLLAAAVLAWGMLRAPHGWLFPPGWWRFW